MADITREEAERLLRGDGLAGVKEWNRRRSKGDGIQNLATIDLRDAANLSGAYLSSANLNDADFRNADLCSAILDNAQRAYIAKVHAASVSNAATAKSHFGLQNWQVRQILAPVTNGRAVTICRDPMVTFGGQNTMNQDAAMTNLLDHFSSMATDQIMTTTAVGLFDLFMFFGRINAGVTLRSALSSDNDIDEKTCSLCSDAYSDEEVLHYADFVGVSNKEAIKWPPENRGSWETVFRQFERAARSGAQVIEYLWRVCTAIGFSLFGPVPEEGRSVLTDALCELGVARDFADRLYDSLQSQDDEIRIKAVEQLRTGLRGSRGNPMPTSESKASGIRVFVSHCHSDVSLAKTIVAILEGCLEVPSEAIRCTSVPGYKHPAGVNLSDAIRMDIETSSVVIAILTEHSLNSGYVVMELGAAWGLKRQTFSILAPGLKPQAIPGPLYGVKAINWGEIDEAATLVETIAEVTGFKKRPQARITASLKGFGATT